MGVLIVNQLSRRRGLLKPQEENEIRTLAKNLFQTSRLSPHLVQELPQLLLKDKKSVGNAVNFVLIAAAGDTRFVKMEVTPQLTEELIEIMKEEFDVL